MKSVHRSELFIIAFDVISPFIAVLTQSCYLTHTRKDVPSQVVWQAIFARDEILTV